MIILKTVEEVKKTTELLKKEGKIIGFVATMGALHEGHLALVRQSVKDNNITFCSIYVNPTQFNNPEDFDNYPNTIENDKYLLKNVDCNYLFLPDFKEMYPNASILKFNFGALETDMEGKHRPGHFNGVALIISKFFNIIQPDNAYFGQKDLQQLAIIKQLTKDLSFPVSIHSCPTLRESNGLAMSSRNQRLSEKDRKKASKIYESLILTKKIIEKNNSINHQSILKEVTSLLQSTSIKLEYLEIVDTNTLQPVNKLSENNKIAICIAAFLGNVRLIDNIIL